MNPDSFKPSNTAVRRRLIVQGVVQGVGFRPFVYGLALQLGLVGFVGNNSAGVFIEVEGDPPVLDQFRQRLVDDAPPLAHIDSLTVESISSHGDDRFVIVHSQAQAGENTLISPDLVTCDDCLHELFDPQNRRFRYPFINCTNCGPRFTIIKDIPYDRPLTTMANFPMCPDCQAEYDNPLDRRFHAQPNACPVCGPHVEFQWSALEIQMQKLSVGDSAPDDPIQAAQSVLAQGGIVAVKGLGGFHLACDATNDQALQTLRQRKGRIDKPFAVMAFDIPAVAQFAEVTEPEAALLTSRQRPIVLLKKRPDCFLSDLVAPGNDYIGAMLPYTPLHYLLLTQHSNPNSEKKDIQPSTLNPQPSTSNLQSSISQSPFSILHSPSSILVMTSGNYSNEPIVKDNDEALDRLASLVDAFLLHNRDIHAHCDDSVIRVFEGRELPVRRSRGYAPFPVKLPATVPSILAVGGELKSTFCLTKGNFAFMSQHIGDMENWETWQAFEKSVAHLKALFRVEPEIIAYDLHPGYLSTKWATVQPPDIRLVPVQHHHAHIAAVMAEHGLDGQQPVIGFSFDGTGYGLDQAIWGGELLVADYQTFRRAAHLKYVPLPGGDASIKRPYRLALAYLWAAGIDWDESLPPVAACPAVERRVVRQQLEKAFNTVPTSSMGRLFDAIAALAGGRQSVTYEAQAAIEFEAIAAPEIDALYEFDLLHHSDAPIEIDAGPVIRAVVTDLRAGVERAVIAAKFHNGVAELVLHLSLQMRRETGLNRVALSGGVFQNVTLLQAAVKRLKTNNFEIYTHRQVPPNDGGLALGQAIVAAVTA
ncbi:MAG: carbamoyltransferase HypF [Anaerolineae bacterium]|nr:carbamoyltransferase HypF [Anaerolineae bacterium]MCB9108151.1 carbamoyltransferase HypF [Anaerolineales bacterium]